MYVAVLNYVLTTDIYVVIPNVKVAMFLIENVYFIPAGH